MVILKSSFNSQYPKIGITNISNEMLHRWLIYELYFYRIGQSAFSQQVLELDTTFTSRVDYSQREWQYTLIYTDSICADTNSPSIQSCHNAVIDIPIVQKTDRTSMEFEMSEELSKKTKDAPGSSITEGHWTPIMSHKSMLN